MKSILISLLLASPLYATTDREKFEALQDEVPKSDTEAYYYKEIDKTFTSLTQQEKDFLKKIVGKGKR